MQQEATKLLESRVGNKTQVHSGHILTNDLFKFQISQFLKSEPFSRLVDDLMQLESL